MTLRRAFSRRPRSRAACSSASLSTLRWLGILGRRVLYLIALRARIENPAVHRGPHSHGIVDAWPGTASLELLDAGQGMARGVAQGSQVVLLLPHRGAIGVDGKLVELAERADKRGEGLLDLVQHNFRHSDIDDDGRRNRKGIAGEEADPLLHTVLIDRKIFRRKPGK